MKLETGLKPGDRIRAIRKVYITSEHEGTGNKKPQLEMAEVIRLYPHHVMVRNRKGTRWCITNAEIYTMAAARGGITAEGASLAAGG